jgi:hypothetical protein
LHGVLAHMTIIGCLSLEGPIPVVNVVFFDGTCSVGHRPAQHIAT